ncbi:conserved hypothetical protein [Polaromonas sp. JS666]|nr:conserved hypothetical protein [Polaromonas sp. JS666]
MHRVKLIEIFKPGKHTAMSGQVISFTEADMQAAAIAYDPAVHEAPLVVGHPKDNLPAYGWVKSLQFADGSVKAELDQVDAAFAELVNAGRYKKISASWYLPDAPANPKPGGYYLRHVGCLGAQPPAIKGLKSASFAASDEGVVEFADWGFTSTRSMFQRMRDWFIDKEGLETADKILPQWEIDSVAEAATATEHRTNQEPAVAGMSGINYQEGAPQVTTPNQGAANTGDANFAEQQRLLTERETAVATREKALKDAEVAEFAEDLVKAGQLLPKDKARVIAFMESLPDNVVCVEFGEGDVKKETPAVQVFREFLKGLPKLVEFGEVGSRGVAAESLTDGMTDKAVADRATAYKAKRDAAGAHISFTEAVDAVHAGTDKE